MAFIINIIKLLSFNFIYYVIIFNLKRIKKKLLILNLTSNSIILVIIFKVIVITYIFL